MADDIDIEEHDILDNPRIQGLLQIKDEPIDLDEDQYEESAVSYDSYDQYKYYTNEDQEQTSYNQTDNPEESENQENNYNLDNQEDLNQEDNNYNLGNQEDLHNQELDNFSVTANPEESNHQEVFEEYYNDEELGDHEEELMNCESFQESEIEAPEAEEYIPDLSDEIYHYKNKIILGTKPCKRPTRDINGAYVSLEDWKERLENSDCYCKECMTLFATQNALDAHNMVAHSFLVALDSPEDSESESPTVEEKPENAPQYCEHCKTYFPSQIALIQHLYDILPMNTTPQPTPVKYNDCTSTSQRIVFSCKLCNSAYLDIRWFKVHMRMVHEMTEEGNYEKMIFNGVCKICKGRFTHLKRFNSHVRMMHIERDNFEPRGSLLKDLLEIPKEKVISSETEEPENDQRIQHIESSSVSTVSKVGDEKPRSKVKFKCIKCKNFFASLGSIKRHQKRFHPGENTIKRITSRKDIQKLLKIKSQTLKRDIEKPQPQFPIKVPEKIKINDNLVPKSCVFNCDKCNINFVTCWSAILHISCVELTMISRYQCDVCCKQFRLRDMKIHEHQHKYNDAFRTYPITGNMNSKMLFWCQKCAVYFEIKKIQAHTPVCTGTSSSVRCKLCDIDVSDILSHMSNHSKHKTKADFIFVDDVLPDEDLTPQKVPEQMSPLKDKLKDPEKPTQKNLKRKQQDSEHSTPTKIPKLDKYEFMYCEKCHTCMKTSRGFHSTGECKRYTSKRNCEFCGLLFFGGIPMNSHEELHKQSNAKLRDFTFVNLEDNKPIVPHIPDYPKCEDCETYYLANHQCGSSKTCKHCKKKFSESVFKVHLLHHKYLKEDAEVNELIKRYETLASTWNILYFCKTCQVATDSYDDVVVHCQNHYNNIHDTTTLSCDICVLRLEESCYKRHKQLHSPKITRDSFKAVEYDYKNLLNEDWLKLFGTLSDAEVHQIVSRSMYVTRFVKMRLILNGPPELTIYKCETCKLYVDPHSIYNHATTCAPADNLPHRKAFSCEFCAIPFSTQNARDNHEKLHSTPNITANSFRIVAFNDVADKEFNKKLQVDAEAAEFQPKTIVGSIKSGVFYQCNICMCCSSNAEPILRHKCLTSEELVKCKKCHLDIPAADLKDHRKWHKRNKDVTKRQIKIVAIDNKCLLRRPVKDGEEKRPVCKLHQCKKCKVCYSFWVPHPTCLPRNQRCRICKYLFTPKSYALHRLWHETYKDATKNDIVVVPLSRKTSSESKEERKLFLKSISRRRKELGVRPPPVSKPKLKPKPISKKLVVYQCQFCKLCSTTLSYVKNHAFCSKKSYRSTCKICDLTFYFVGIKNHKAWHMENKKHNRQCIKVVRFKNQKILKSKDEVSTKQKTLKKDEMESTKQKILKKDEVGSTNQKILVSKDKIESANENILKINDDESTNTENNIEFKNHKYWCKKCGSSSKATIFLNKHKCATTRESEFVYYRCENCEVCVTSNRHDICTPAQHIRSCAKCKLKFSVHNLFDHMKKHVRHKTMTRGKITVIPISKSKNSENSAEGSNKSVEKVSTVYKCSCGLHFISHKTIEKHFTVCSPDHDIPADNCSKCGLLFPTIHLVSHLCNHHSYGKGTIEVKTIPTVTFYRCGSCKCLFMNESRVLKHNKCCDPNNIKGTLCDECDLEFHASEIKNHRESHKTSSDLSKPCRIVTINDTKLDVSEQMDESAARDAEYSESDANLTTDDPVTADLVDDDKNVYRCGLCGTHFLKRNSVEKHIQLNACKPERAVPCSHCGLEFMPQSLFKHVKLHHEVQKLTIEDLAIYEYNNVAERRFNRVSSKPIAPKTREVVIDLYKCHVCGIHFTKAMSLKKHLAALNHDIKKYICTLCDLPFNHSSLMLHKEKHHNRMIANVKCIANIINDNVEFSESVQNDSEPDETENGLEKQEEIQPQESNASENDRTKDIIYYNCKKCDVIFLSLRRLDMHFEDEHRCVSLKETCKVCGLTITRNSMGNHKEHHVGRTSGVFLIQDIDDESDSVNKLYKCLECGYHFLNSRTGVAHMVRGVHGARPMACSDCGLTFSHVGLKMHQRVHHRTHSLRLEDFVIDTSIGKYRRHEFGFNDDLPQSSSEKKIKTDDPEDTDEQQNAKTTASSTKLYKCGTCNVYFLTQATCYKHIIKHTPMDPKEYIECKLCSFQFRIVSLNTHIRKHHKTDFEFDKVLIEEYRPKTEEDKVPKIDIYYAKDKVQSRLISTTTDDAVVDSAEVSQSHAIELSDDSRDTVIISDTNNLETKTELDSDNKNVMVNIPSLADVKESIADFKESFAEVKEENDSTDVRLQTNEGVRNSNEGVRKSNKGARKSNECVRNSNEGVRKSNEGVRKSNEGARKSNEGARKSNEGAGNVSETNDSTENGYSCAYCPEKFVSRRAKDFHEDLDHLDALKDCPICKKSYPASILNELHLQITCGMFTCCVCGEKYNNDMLPHHSHA
ncbi:uncharacterized protein LOC114360893 isoform X2 [Ostrinia furnacalis]|uniref:uncharacterized protein LOC114360893 isoform X2 n=1 Tax=Ostrinia furnacalis TaxID=93504 RepID=UPI001038CBBA|nr:uncharacterized protein LOC114360893 isoform X2 [Ostrinia furnacalis]